MRNKIRIAAITGLLLRPWGRRSWGAFLVAILLCATGSSRAQGSQVGMNQGNRLRAVEPTARNLELTPSRWEHPDVDRETPEIDRGVPCPAQRVLAGASRQAQELAANLERFSATEQVEHVEFSNKDTPQRSETRSFAYVVFIQKLRSGMVNVEEYRDGSVSPEVFPAKIATTGLPAMALIFLPNVSAQFAMTCEGLGHVNGQAAWRVYFQQLTNEPNRVRSFGANGQIYLVKLRGRAWIAADNYQILRLETDLVEPLPVIRLKTEHMAIEYGPVAFRKLNGALWLPVKAEIYADFLGRRYYRRHTFHDFQLFSVDATQQIQAPKEP